MKSNEANIFVLIASIIVGIMISLNMSFSNKVTMTILDTKQYEEAVNDKTRLLGQITNMNDEYNLGYAKLSKYEDVGQSNTKVAQEMENELLKNKMFFGTTDIHGPGIILTLNDAEASKRTTDSMYMVHNYDVAMVLDELKRAGAEAISVNGERITDRTSVNCDGVFIQANGIQVYTPFNIDVIGNKDVIYEFINRKGGYLMEMSLVRELSVNIQQVNDVKIKAFNKNITSKFSTTLDSVSSKK